MTIEEIEKKIAQAKRQLEIPNLSNEQREFVETKLQKLELDKERLENPVEEPKKKKKKEKPEVEHAPIQIDEPEVDIDKITERSKERANIRDAEPN